MKKSAMIFSFIIISVFIASVNANAEIVSFSDTSNYWPGWGNGTSDDSIDAIGIPSFTEGQATITSGRLTNLTFNRASGTSPYWDVLSPGDLFIDTGADQTWDYVVDLSNWGVSSKYNSDPGSGHYGIYSISLALGDTSGGYILSGADNKDGWKGYYIRQGHPVAANNIAWADDGSTYFSGWGGGSTTQYSFFDFKGEGLDLGPSGQFTIGWGVNCANDVIYETLRYQPVPEPASVALLGMGLCGLFFRRKRKGEGI